MTSGSGSSYMTSSQISHKDPKQKLIVSFLTSAINFTSSLALSSSQCAHALIQTINQKFEVSGPRCFCATLDFSSRSQDGGINIPLTVEIYTLFYSILKGVYNYGVYLADNDGLLVSIVASLGESCIHAWHADMDMLAVSHMSCAKKYIMNVCIF